MLVILLGMLACYLWLSWAFSLFPLDAGVERIAGRLVAGVIRDLSLSIVASLPGLMIVVLIFLLTAYHSPGEGGSRPSPPAAFRFPAFIRRPLAPPVGLSRWSSGCLPSPPPTRSFPAPTLAFKGISVFFGLMLTLGSTGVMTHAMSGPVLIYSRALRKGDWIRLADNEGQVSEIGVLATKILTRENYIVTVPNAVVVSGKIINLSAESADGGVNLTTSVTIGYDTPWRQVHALLELAARRPGDRSANCAGGA